MTWSSVNKTGLVLLAVAAVANFIPVPPPDGVPGPPLWVLIIGAVLGLIALIAIVMAWRKGDRRAAWVAIGALIINGLLAVPAFFVDGVPGWLVALAGVYVAVTVVGVVLTLLPNRERA